jgi:glutamate racemase
MSFIGMEPAVKPAAEHTSSKVVGVLATTATFQGELFASVVERFAQGVEVIQQACPGLVEQIEAGELESLRTEAMLRGWLEPMLVRGIDALALACTHYPFVMPLIQRICGSSVRVIDPAPAIARQTRRILEGTDALAPSSEQGNLECRTSGDAATFIERLRLLGITADTVRAARWTPAGPDLR